jgi:hypothetical protein
MPSALQFRHVESWMTVVRSSLESLIPTSADSMRRLFDACYRVLVRNEGFASETSNQKRVNQAKCHKRQGRKWNGRSLRRHPASATPANWCCIPTELVWTAPVGKMELSECGTAGTRRWANEPGDSRRSVLSVIISTGTIGDSFVEFSRVFKPGGADCQELLALLELLLNEQPPAPGPAPTSRIDRRISKSAK